MKTLIAGVVGGVLLFVCSAVFHMATPFGHSGMSALPPDRELPVVDAMKSVMTERRLYFFPGLDMEDREAMEKEPYKSRFAAGPTGIIAFSPGPGVPFGASYLLREFAFNLVEGCIAAFVVAQLAASVSFLRRVLVVGLIGLAGTLATDGSLWTWFHFPDAYFGAQLVMNTVGSLVAGLAIAKLVRPPRTVPGT